MKVFKLKRKALGLSQTEIGKVTQSTQTHISNFEKLSPHICKERIFKIMSMADKFFPNYQIYYNENKDGNTDKRIFAEYIKRSEKNPATHIVLDDDKNQSVYIID